MGGILQFKNAILLTREQYVDEIRVCEMDFWGSSTILDVVSKFSLSNTQAE